MQFTHSEREWTLEYESVRRTPRHSLVVDIDMTDLQSEIQIRARTTMLCLLGCVVDTLELFPRGLSVNVRLFHGGAEVRAFGKVLYSRSDLGMGLAFTIIEPEDKRILDWWVTEFVSIPILKR
jgi:hypothetical protein